MAFVGGNGAQNQGRMFVMLKPLGERKISADQVIARLRPKTVAYSRRDAVPAVGAGPADRRAHGRMRSISTRCRAKTWTSCTSGRPGCWSSCARFPQLKDVNSDQQISGLEAERHHRSRYRRAAGHHPAADRRRALRRIRPAADFDHLPDAEPVPRGAGSRSAIPAHADALKSVYVITSSGRAGAAVMPSRTLSRRPPRSRSITRVNSRR